MPSLRLYDRNHRIFPVGKPIPVEKCEKPSLEEVKRVQAKYIAELTRYVPDFFFVSKLLKSAVVAYGMPTKTSLRKQDCANSALSTSSDLHEYSLKSCICCHSFIPLYDIESPFTALIERLPYSLRLCLSLIDYYSWETVTLCFPSLLEHNAILHLWSTAMATRNRIELLIGIRT